MRLSSNTMLRIPQQCKNKIIKTSRNSKQMMVVAIGNTWVWCRQASEWLCGWIRVTEKVSCCSGLKCGVVVCIRHVEDSTNIYFGWNVCWCMDENGGLENTMIHHAWQSQENKENWKWYNRNGMGNLDQSHTVTNTKYELDAILCK